MLSDRLKASTTRHLFNFLEHKSIAHETFYFFFVSVIDFQYT